MSARLLISGPGAVPTWRRPAHLVSDLLELDGDVLVRELLRRRRAALEDLFAARPLSAPWALCPQTEDRGRHDQGSAIPVPARRAHLNTVLDWAVRARDDRRHRADLELFGVLCDFFTRVVVFPGQMDRYDGQRHASDPSRTLSHLLIQRLENFGLDLEDLPELELPERLVALLGDAVVKCVAQALRSSRWFTAAASVTGPGRSAGGVPHRVRRSGALRLGDAPRDGDTKA